MSIVQQDIASLLDGWIEAERSGVIFPVPFDLAWKMAGYSRKDHGKRDGLKGLQSGLEFSTERGKNALAGRPSDSIMLSLDGMKHMCLMACTEAGREIRQYFIESEKKWRLVKEVAPQIAEEVEILSMKIELAKIEAQKAELENKTLGLRQYIVEVLPKAKADRILGVKEIATTEIRTKIVDDSGFILNAANTVSKTELANRYGFISKTGRPDTKLVGALIDEAIASGAIPNPWHDIRVVASSGFDAELVPVLDKFFEANPAQRQRWIGEN